MGRRRPAICVAIAAAALAAAIQAPAAHALNSTPAETFVTDGHVDAIVPTANASHIGGQDRHTIAALDATTGQATGWNPAPSYPPAPPEVVFSMNALAVSGQTVYAAGQFESIGGKSRYHLAALDAATGEATAWSPNLIPHSPYGIVHTLVVGPDGSLWAGAASRASAPRRRQISPGSLPNLR